MEGLDKAVAGVDSSEGPENPTEKATEKGDASNLEIAAESGKADVVASLITDIVDQAELERATINAIENGHAAVVAKLVEKSKDLANFESDIGFTPLCIAAELGHDDVAECLIKMGAYINSKTKTGSCALKIAAEKGHMSIVEKLIEHADLNKQAGDSGATPLFMASQEGYTGIVKVLLEKNKGQKNIHRPTVNGFTPLCIAAEMGHIEIVVLLLESRGDIDIDQPSTGGSTPLKQASKNGHTKVVDVLLKAGANINTHDKQTCTPVSWAAWNGHHGVLRSLVAERADLNTRDEFDCTPLICAARSGDRKCVQLLIEQQVDVNANWEGTFKSSTPLWVASENGSNDGDDKIIKLLLENKAEYKPHKKVAPITIAARQGHAEIVQFFAKQGHATVKEYYTKHDFQAELGTALVQAAMRNHETVVHRLIQEKTDAEHENVKEVINMFHDATKKAEHNYKWLMKTFDRLGTKDEELEEQSKESAGSLDKKYPVREYFQGECWGDPETTLALDQSGVTVVGHGFNRNGPFIVDGLSPEPHTTWDLLVRNKYASCTMNLKQKDGEKLGEKSLVGTADENDGSVEFRSITTYQYLQSLKAQFNSDDEARNEIPKDWVQIREKFFREDPVKDKTPAKYDDKWRQLRAKVEIGTKLWTAESAEKVQDISSLQSKVAIAKFKSVNEAIQNLNSMEGHKACPEGFCLVADEKHDWYLCKRSDKEEADVEVLYGKVASAAEAALKKLDELKEEANTECRNSLTDKIFDLCLPKGSDELKEDAYEGFIDTMLTYVRSRKNANSAKELHEDKLRILILRFADPSGLKTITKEIARETFKHILNNIEEEAKQELFRMYLRCLKFAIHKVELPQSKGWLSSSAPKLSVEIRLCGAKVSSEPKESVSGVADFKGMESLIIMLTPDMAREPEKYYVEFEVRDRKDGPPCGEARKKLVDILQQEEHLFKEILLVNNEQVGTLRLTIAQQSPKAPEAVIPLFMSAKACANCYALLRPDSIFCENCGTPLQEDVHKFRHFPSPGDRVEFKFSTGHIWQQARIRKVDNAGVVLDHEDLMIPWGEASHRLRLQIDEAKTQNRDEHEKTRDHCLMLNDRIATSLYKFEMFEPLDKVTTAKGKVKDALLWRSGKIRTFILLARLKFGLKPTYLEEDVIYKQLLDFANRKNMRLDKDEHQEKILFLDHRECSVFVNDMLQDDQVFAAKVEKEKERGEKVSLHSFRVASNRPANYSEGRQSLPSLVEASGAEKYQAGAIVYRYSESQKAWFKTMVTAVDGHGVEITLAPGRKLTGRELEKLFLPNELKWVPQATGVKKYRVGECVQYYSESKKDWFDAKVTAVDAQHTTIEIDLKPGTKFTGRELEERLRWPQAR